MDRLISEQQVLYELVKLIDRYGQIYHDEAMKAIKAIPSAEPREVLYSGDGYADGKMVYDMAECPNCGREFEDGDEVWNCNFCPDCGQALKWEGEEE